MTDFQLVVVVLLCWVSFILGFFTAALMAAARDN